MRKKSMLTPILLGLVILGTAANLLVFFRYHQILSAAQRLQMHAQRLQAQASVLNRNLGVVRNLAGECLEYSRKSPAMESLLKSFLPLLQRLELVTPAVPAQPPR